MNSVVPSNAPAVPAAGRRSLLAGAAVLFALAGSLWYGWSAVAAGPVHVHASTHLSAAERMASGAVPFRDFRLYYTPAAYYIWSLCFRLFPDWSYESCMLVMMALGFTSGALIFAITLKLGSARRDAALFGAGAVVMMFLHGLTYPILEPFFLVPWLAAWLILLAFPGSTVAAPATAGALAGVAFWCKQPALAAVISTVFLAYSGSRPARRSLAALLGAASGLAIPLAALAWVSALPPLEILALLAGPGYPRQPARLGEALQDLITALHLGAGALLLLGVKRYRFQVLALLLMPTAFYAPVLSLHGWEYYYLPVIAFGWTGTALLFRYLEEEHRPMVAPLRLVVCCAVAAFGWCAVLRGREAFTAGGRAAQLREAAELHRYWAPGSRVLFVPTHTYLFVGRYLPIDDFRPGYGSIDDAPWPELVAAVEQARRVAVLFDYVQAPRREFEGLLERSGSVKIGSVGALELYEKREPPR